MNLRGRIRSININQIQKEFLNLQILEIKWIKNGGIKVKIQCPHNPFLPFSYDSTLHPPCGRIRWAYLAALRKSKKLGFVPGKCKGCSTQKWHTNENGYFITIIKGKPYRANRVALEAKLCRKLRDDENAHHVNGNTLDNRPTNLVPRLETKHGAGITEDDAAMWLNSGTKYVVKKCKS